MTGPGSAPAIRLAIDDFGTGHSSLAYLKELPVDVLKLDKAFVSGMADNRSDAAIVFSTIELAHTLGLEVVAEGVESDDVWRMLASHGCEQAQGYAIAKPMSADAINRWLARFRAGVADRATEEPAAAAQYRRADSRSTCGEGPGSVQAEAPAPFIASGYTEFESVKAFEAAARSVRARLDSPSCLAELGHRIALLDDPFRVHATRTVDPSDRECTGLVIRDLEANVFLIGLETRP